MTADGDGGCADGRKTCGWVSIATMVIFKKGFPALADMRAAVASAGDANAWRRLALATSASIALARVMKNRIRTEPGSKLSHTADGGTSASWATAD